MLQVLVVVVLHFLNIITIMKYNNKIISFAILCSFISMQSQAQNVGLGFSVNKKQEINNNNIYTYLHQWNSSKSKKLLDKIEQYSLIHKEDGPLRTSKDRAYKAWHVRKMIYYSSSCLDKAIFSRPGVPSHPSSVEYSERIKNIHTFMNLKEDIFPLPNERVFNNFCSKILEVDFDSGYCLIPTNKTISVDMRIDFSVVNAINMTDQAKELQQYIPVKCVLSNKTPEMLETYNAKAKYTITKPFSEQIVQTPQGKKSLNVGEAILSLPDAITSDGKMIEWKTAIIQHKTK